MKSSGILLFLARSSLAYGRLSKINILADKPIPAERSEAAGRSGWVYNNLKLSKDIHLGANFHTKFAVISNTFGTHNPKVKVGT